MLQHLINKMKINKLYLKMEKLLKWRN